MNCYDIKFSLLPIVCTLYAHYFVNIPNCNCWHMYCGQEVSDMSWVGDGKTCNEGSRIGDRVLIEWSKDGFLAWMGLNSKGCTILQGSKLYEGTQNDVKRSQSCELNGVQNLWAYEGFSKFRAQKIWVRHVVMSFQRTIHKIIFLVL